MIKVYLASPYSNPDPAIREARNLSACKKAGELMNEGYLVFSPIAHSHPIANVCDLPRDWKFWEKYDKTFIEWCDELWILTISGWENSTGIANEIEIANNLEKPIKLIGRNNSEPY